MEAVALVAGIPVTTPEHCGIQLTLDISVLVTRLSCVASVPASLEPFEESFA
jgi:hypothetical protein